MQETMISEIENWREWTSVCDNILNKTRIERLITTDNKQLQNIWKLTMRVSRKFVDGVWKRHVDKLSRLLGRKLDSNLQER